MYACTLHRTTIVWFDISEFHHNGNGCVIYVSFYVTSFHTFNFSARFHSFQRVIQMYLRVFFLSMTFDCQPKSTSLFCLECFSCFMCHWDDSITNECLYVFSVYWTWIYSCCFYSERSKVFMRVYRAVSELFWQLHGNPIVYYLHLFIFRLY